MNLDPEDVKMLERVCRMLKAKLKGLKRLVIHLAPEGQEDSVDYELHGKVKV